MPNRADVELLNNAITGLGQSFAQNRRETTDAAYRQKVLDRQIEQENAAQAHYGAEAQHWKNEEETQKQAAVDKDDQATFQALTELNASGALDESSRPDVNAWLSGHAKWGKIGIALQAPAQKPPPQSGQSSVAKALETADTFAAKADAEKDPVKKAKYLDSESILRDSARKAAGIDAPDTITEDVPAETDQPAKAAVSHLFRADEPALPAVAGHPAYKRSYKVSHGASPTATARAGKGKPTRAVAADYVTKFGQAGAKAALAKDGYDPSGYAD